MTEQEINELIKSEHIDTNQISDGYHTFGELYEHRIANYLIVCAFVSMAGRGFVWRSRKDPCGNHFGDWFILGINKDKDKQITYHLPMKNWNDCNFADTLEKAHDYNHTSADTLNRLKLLKISLLDKIK